MPPLRTWSYTSANAPIVMSWGGQVKAFAADQTYGIPCGATGAGGNGEVELVVSRNAGDYTALREFCVPLRNINTYDQLWPAFPLQFSGINSADEQRQISGNVEDVLSRMPRQWFEGSAAISARIHALSSAEWDAHPHVQNECADTSGSCYNLGVFVKNTINGWKVYVKRGIALSLVNRWRIAYALAELRYTQMTPPSPSWEEVHTQYFPNYGSGGQSGCMDQWSCTDKFRDLYSWLYYPFRDLSDDSIALGRLPERMKNANNPGWRAKWDWLLEKGLISEDWHHTVVGWADGTIAP
jgi:hypothetical protein